MRFLHSPRVLAISTLSFLLLAAASTGAGAATLDQPTYAGDVARILNQHCVTCHSPGQIAPMSLRTFDEVRPWVRSIARSVEAGLMPPWHATSDSRQFANDRRLPPRDVEIISNWVRAGAPAGDLTAAPEPPPPPASEWKLGEPDFVATFEEITVEPNGRDQFHRPIARVVLPEDRWVRAIEILPGNTKVVHHVIAMAVKGFDFDPQQGWLGAWAAGTDPMVFPAGVGRLIPKGANILADMHYHPTDQVETDVTRIGLHFADPGEVERELANVWIVNDAFEIPPGAKNHEVRATSTFWQAGKITGLIPHMHYRGTDFTFIAHWPDGRSETLMAVPRWDFNWQTVYELAEPIDIPAGTKIECIAHYDNSAGNPNNPDPSKSVTFGDESYDEMMIGFVDFIAKDSLHPKTPFEIRTEKVSELAAKWPGQVWAISGKPVEERDEPNSYAPLYLPREGDGELWVVMNRQLHQARLHSIAWDGDAFTAKLETPYGDWSYTGEVKNDGIHTTMHLPGDRTNTWDGELAK
jgi:mono/diheme cytochrome c family protein